MKNSISLCMIVKNEEDFLDNCLSSVKEIVSEMIVVDTGSEDRTIEIAERHEAKVIQAEWKNNFAEARNIGIEHATGEWILFLDADEELHKDSIEELKKWTDYPDAEGYFLRVYNHFGQNGQEASVNPTIRMFRNRIGYRFSGAIHEQIADSMQLQNPQARFVMTTVRIDHYGYQSAVRDKKNKSSRNITLLEQELKNTPDHAFHLYNIGVEYLQIGAVQKALESFQKSRQLVSPQINYAHLLYKCEARCFGALNLIDEAIRCCNEGLELFPDYTDLHHYKGSYYIVKGDCPSAIEHLQKAAEIGETPKYHTEAGMGTFSTHYLLGLAFESTQEDDKAVDHYYKSYQASQASQRPLFRMFQLLRVTGRQGDLLPFIQKKFRMNTKKQRETLLTILMRTHCYSIASELIKSWLKRSSTLTGQEVRQLLSTEEDCLLLKRPCKEGEGDYAKISEEKRQTLMNEQNPFDAMLPSSFHPVLNEESVDSILQAERGARLLFSQGFFKAFQEHTNLWKKEHSSTSKNFRVNSIIQLVNTLCFNAEIHIDSALENITSSELLNSAKLTLPFDEGFIE
ncbi:glycosyltransferase [Rossellomorea vietnamensis]|uniref:Glycosyltransferase 2-like domain-containing protein n=1 Tax=Rossellomorea vietnamensis TaxID=218284 RepID=A0A0P6VXY2_9BACI|nr:glycosyltransferase family 2 protein [Rossellomorea vietnamensis]KPL57695.1 hypothetical protein AM506_20840 [Rossellomorea vietnamensis]